MRSLTTPLILTAWVLALLLVPGLGSPAHADEEDAAVLRALEKAFDSNGATAQIAALREVSAASSEAVSKVVAKTALRSDELDVLIAGLEALGRMRNPETVKILHRAYKTNREAKKNERYFVALLRAIGQVRDPSSVVILINKPFKYGTENTSRARIYGLGNIRTVEAVEALLKGMQLSDPTARGMVGAGRPILLPDFRTAMTVLTGEDQGEDKRLWQAWWRRSKKSFEIAPTLPVLPAKLETLWEDFWGRPYPVSAPANGMPNYEWVRNPTKEQVKAALDDLEQARKSKNASVKLVAIYKNMLIVDPKVVKMIHKVAKKSGRSVIEAGIDALGWMPHKSALKELQGIYKRHRDLYKFENYFVRMLKGIGRHSDKSSLDMLLDKPFKGLTIASGRARILGVARIRHKDSVEKLMKAMMLSGGSGRRDTQMSTGTQPFMGVIRVALVILTGVDQGVSKGAWAKWWRENKRTFKMKAERPEVDESMREAWEEFWEERY